MHSDNFSAFTKNGTFTIDTGKFTGRSPKGKLSRLAEQSSWFHMHTPLCLRVFPAAQLTLLPCTLTDKWIVKQGDAEGNIWW